MGKRVLLPVDGSPCSLRAVAHAIAERGRSGLPDGYEIHLVNVQPPLPRDVTRFASHEQVAGFRQDEGARALAEAEALLAAAGVPYTVHVDVGHAAEAICRRAEALRCDEILMGTHGHGAVAEWLLGSVAQQVVRLAPVPVLLVR